MRALVTGGGGFLGEALSRALVARGDRVRILARGDYPALRELGIETVRGDITDAKACRSACEGIEVVFHTAAKAGGWGDEREYEAINVEGTRHLLDAAQGAKVAAFVHTSSPSIVHADTDIEGANESIPIATHFLAAYPRTKARSEQLALAASTSSFRVVALRPHFIWGPGDHHLLPRLIERAKQGKLRRIGSKNPKTDTTYIENCVSGHLLAADALRSGSLSGGKPYFISDGDPIGVWDMADRLLRVAGAPPVGPPVPERMAYGIASAVEGVYRLLGKQSEPAITRFAVSELTHAQWFDISAAKRDFGYAPKVSIAEGITRLEAWFEAQKPAA